MKIIMRQAWNRAGINIWLIEEISPYQSRIYKPISGETYPDPFESTQMLPEPTAFLPFHKWNELKESLIEEMRYNGIMQDVKFIEGQLKAKDEHIADLRMMLTQATMIGKPTQ